MPVINLERYFAFSLLEIATIDEDIKLNSFESNIIKPKARTFFKSFIQTMMRADNCHVFTAI